MYHIETTKRSLYQDPASQVRVLMCLSMLNVAFKVHSQTAIASACNAHKPHLQGCRVLV